MWQDRLSKRRKATWTLFRRYDHGKIVSGRGVIEGNRIIIQADNMNFTVEQFAEHEIGHAEETAELNEESAKLIRERFSEEEFAEVVDAYIRNLEGYSKEEIISEIVQDARAGINNFGKETAKYKETVREVYDRARNNAVSQEANGERETRGPGAKYSYAGEKSKKADMLSLEKAKQMEAEGADAETIRRETTWFKGADGQWRYMLH